MADGEGNFQPVRRTGGSTVSPVNLGRKWHVGDVTITKVVEHELVVDIRAILPAADPAIVNAIEWLRPHFMTAEGLAVISMHALLIEAGGRRILVDTCCGNDKKLDAIAAAIHQYQGPFLADLAASGFPRESIDTVLCTHLHFDHIGWNTMFVDGRWLPTFPNARYLMSGAEHRHAADFAVASHGEGDVWAELEARAFTESIGPIAEAGLLELVDSDHRICDEVSLIPTAGHSPGHVSVLIRSRGQEAIITGDVTHHPAQLAHVDWGSGADNDPDHAARTRGELFARCADKPIEVIGTHWSGVSSGHVVSDGGAYRLRT